MKVKVEKLREVAGAEDKAELGVLFNAKKTTLLAYNSEPTAARKRDHDAAVQGLAALVDKLWPKYFSSERVYKNRGVLIAELAKEGLVIKKTKLYTDCKRPPSEGGLLVEADGTVRRSSLETWLAHPQGGGKICEHRGLIDKAAKEDIDKILSEKLLLEVSILRSKEARERLACEVEQGKWLPRDDFQMELAGRAGVLDVMLGYWINTSAGELIDMVGGDQSKRSEFIEEQIDRKNKALAEFCSVDTYQVMFV